MAENQSPETVNDPSGFGKALNRHGYPFHHRTLRVAQEACDNRSSAWIFQVSEFPIEVRGKHSRIDYVLQYGQRDVYLVIECKRANPRMKRWCFARAPYVRRNPSSEYLLNECLLFERSTGNIWATVVKDHSVPNGQAFDIALEMKVKDVKGDDDGVGGRGAIEDAATQVNLGVNGLIEYFRQAPPQFSGNARMVFIPVVLTTADLFAANVDLAAADIETGEIDPATVQLTPKEWVFYQYPVSPGLKHSVPQAKPASDIVSQVDLGKALDANYLRTVAIVQGKYFAHFLSWFGVYIG
jgi:hypothetical protein